MAEPIDLDALEARCAASMAARSDTDPAHDMEHIRRVVVAARQLAVAEGADLAVVLPAAWLHDCVSVPKSSPLRPRASALAAEEAARFLGELGYPAALLPAVAHAIVAHSFSAGVPPETPEARVVQDADRLDALGAVGIARTLMLGAVMGRPLYDPAEPFPLDRPPDDARSSIDHFYTKLLRLAGTMQTAAGRAEAERRTAFMRGFLAQLGQEIGAPAEHPPAPFHIRPLADAERPAIAALARELWGDDLMVVHGERYSLSQLPGFVAEAAGAIVGLGTYRLEGGACELVSLDSMREGQGIGSALLAAAEAAARAAGCRRLWLITTNDNLRALGFYQRRGYALVAVHPGAVARARAIKPSIPLLGEGGIPIRDEIELERHLD